MWYEAWCKAVEAARDGLTATLIIKHPKSGRLYVNFDPEILQLIRRDKLRNSSPSLVLMSFRSVENTLLCAMKQSRENTMRF